MPRDFVINDVCFPMLLAIFVGCCVLNWAIAWLCNRLKVNRFVWHPPLFQLAIFVCVFSAAALAYLN